MTHGKLLEDYYYIENGLTVLTEKFHLNRGYCCGNGCRHCPYQYENVSESTRQKLPPPRLYFDAISEPDA